MTAMQYWTPGQWAVFGLTIAAGLAAAVLLWRVRSAVIGWTAPAPMRYAEHSSPPRPSLVLAVARPQLPAVVTIEHDPMTIDYSSHGIGALPDLLAADADPTLRTSAEISAEESAWVNAYADLTSLMPETDAAREGMRVAIEPALRTARLWLVRAGETGARAALSSWRMDTPTGEWPAYDVQTRMAHALLVS